MPNWHELAIMSHYQTAVAVKDAVLAGDTTQALEGLEELIDALARSERRALRSQLIRLMQHIVKWHVQPERRSWSWVATIRNARREIADIQRETPSLTRHVLEAMWDDCLEAARDAAAGEMQRAVPLLSLTWEAVFLTPYTIEEE
jgi:hypothetical protein